MKMENIAGKTLIVALFPLLLSGCGLTQRLSQGTVAIGNALFYPQVTTLHLDLRAREGVNRNGQGAALATVVRVWQLKDRQAFDATDYATLLRADSGLLQGDLLAENAVQVRPGGAVSLDIPLAAATRYVAVGGLFLSPDLRGNQWRLVLALDDLSVDKARVIELGDGTLTLLAREEAR